MILHTVNKSPTQDSTLHSCLQMAQPGSGILLIETGVYGAVANEANTKLFKEILRTHNVYALEPDLAARGLTGTILPALEAVSYSGFGELSLQFSKVQSWV